VVANVKNVEHLWKNVRSVKAHANLMKIVQHVEVNARKSAHHVKVQAKSIITVNHVEVMAEVLLELTLPSVNFVTTLVKKIVSVAMLLES